MTKKEIMKERVEKNLKVLQLLHCNNTNISDAEKRSILNIRRQLSWHLNDNYLGLLLNVTI